VGTTLETPPAVEPVTVEDEVRKHCRVTTLDDDDLLDGLIKAARGMAEDHTGWQLITATWKLFLDNFPGSSGIIELPYPPLQSVTHIKYYDGAGDLQTISVDDYQVDTDSLFGRIMPEKNATWPTVQSQRFNAVEIQFDAGFGDAGSDVPQGIRQAILLTVGHWYENREAVIVGTTASELPLSVQSLLNQNCVGQL